MSDRICEDYPAVIHADCPVHPNGVRNAILGLIGATTAAADQAEAMTDAELADRLLTGRWSTIEVHEAGRRLQGRAASVPGTVPRTYAEGDRCEVCGFWWWKDGKWHSLVPKVYVGIQEEARWTRCPDHLGDRPTPAREGAESDARTQT